MDERIASLSVEALRQNLKTEWLGRRIMYYERVASTNDVARQLAEAGEPEGTIVVADEQLAGRGRFGRTWAAPARSSLLMSVILRPPLMPSQVGRVTMAIALGACDGIRAETGLGPRIKWPNDILLNGKKCAGILAEANTTADRIEYAVFGIGLNVNFSATTGGIPDNATTIADNLGRPCPRERLFGALWTAVERFYVRLKAGANLQAEWAARSATLGQAVHAQTPWGEEIGIAQAVDEDGALVLRRHDGTSIRLVSAEVTLASSQSKESP